MKSLSLNALGKTALTVTAMAAASTVWLACHDAVPETVPADPPFVPGPESCDPANPDALRQFGACSTGSGIFGKWTVDDLGLPAYDYGLDENVDPRAAFFNTEKKDRREHWAAFGNARISAMSYNDGYVEVTTQDRGETYLNKFDDSQSNFAGGFGYLDDGESTWCTAYKWRSPGSITTRRFGMGYAEASMVYRDVSITRRTFAPDGDAPAVIDQVVLENFSKEKKTLKYYEYWDVGRRSVEINWIVSGIPFSTIPAAAVAARDARNGLFDEAVAWDPASGLLGVRRTGTPGDRPDPVAPSPVDYYPGDPFLAVLEGSVDAIYTDQSRFFGAGGVASPTAVSAQAQGDDGGSARKSGLGQPLMLGMRSDVTLAPGEKRTLRYAYGYAPMGQPFAVDPAWRDASRDLRTEAKTSLSNHLLYFASDRDPVLHREMAWHSSQIEASVVWREYWGHHVVPQGSAYLYLHGADGAARDLALFSLPLAYTHPELAKEELLFVMGMTFAKDKRISYAFQGHGMLDDALGLHAKPSDQDIFFLFALSEYVGATRDEAFLDEPAAYYPKEALPDAHVFDHVHDAVRHLFDVVGVGPHGLVHIGDGDWSDGIVFEAPDRNLAMKDGESVPNTQMAVAILPRVADLVEPRDPALAAEIRLKTSAMKTALASAWTAGGFFGRAYFGDGKLVHDGAIDLEAQVWALIGDSFAQPADRATLVDHIATTLDDPSPTGAANGGAVWPAISGLLTLGYARSDQDRAWHHLVKNTLAAHALAFPSIWYGIWTAPDGLNSNTGDRPGEAWYSPATPMVDFPAMNNNAHAMPMLALLRVAGIEASAKGLVIDPHVPGAAFSLSTQLVDLSQRGPKISGTYRPSGNAAGTLEVRAPRGTVIASATLDGVAIVPDPGGASVVLAIPPTQGKGVSFEVLSKAP